ncbi:MAG: hypothetical protein AMXMBFR47_09060 [Planctomycetota bacterium]
MTHRSLRLFTVVVALLVTGPRAFAFADAPTDEQVRKAVQHYEKNRKSGAKPDPLVAEALKGIDLDKLTLKQFEMLGPMRDTAPNEMMPRFRDRLAELGKSTDEDGAVALALRAGTFEAFTGKETEAESTAAIDARIDAIVLAVIHPAFEKAVKSGRGCGVFWYSYFYSENPRLLKSGAVPKMAALISDDWPAKRIDDLLAFAEAFGRSESGLSKDQITHIRTTATRIGQKVSQDPATDEETRTRLLEALGAINSAWNLGELINRPAPTIRFLWCSDKKLAPKSFKEFQGRVVLVDFWATWCGPCVAAFPHVRELRERYKDSPVTILGITSLQGWMLRPWEEQGKRRSGKLSRDEELGAMDEWMRKMDMTWTVAVSQESCFNPDFGVRGIPSVAIIDAKGIVRYAGLSAFDETIEAKLDALLQEAGAPVPPKRKAAP